MIILRQKEYGLKDSYNKALDKKIDKHNRKASNYRSEALKNCYKTAEGIKNDDLVDRLTKTASKKSVVGRSPGWSCMIGDRKVLKYQAERGNKFAEKALKENKSLIMTKNNPTAEVLAHEMGHVENYNSKNPIVRLRNRKGNRISKRINSNDYLKSTGLGYSIINSEEKGASKKGIKLLKKHGATENELGIAAKDYKRAYNTYKYTGKAETEKSRADVLRKLKIK